MNRIKQYVLCCTALSVMLPFSGCGGESSAGMSSAAEQTSATIASQTSATTSATTTSATTTSATTTSATTTSATTTSAATTTTTTAATAVTTTTAPAPSARKDFTRPAEYDALLEDTAFVGDSICKGLLVYHCLPEDHVIAQGSVGARNILESKFPFHGTEVGAPYALSVLKPKYVVFSMGMNDVRMTTKEKFCENYEKLLDTVQNILPDAKLYVASITPVSADCDFTTNAHIDEYNEAIRAYLGGLGKGYGYLDIGVYLKNSYNALSAEYSGSDGIHLKSGTYQPILYAVCEQISAAG